MDFHVHGGLPANESTIAIGRCSSLEPCRRIFLLVGSKACFTSRYSHATWSFLSKHARPRKARFHWHRGGVHWAEGCPALEAQKEFIWRGLMWCSSGQTGGGCSPDQHAHTQSAHWGILGNFGWRLRSSRYFVQPMEEGPHGSALGLVVGGALKLTIVHAKGVALGVWEVKLRSCILQLLNSHRNIRVRAALPQMSLMFRSSDSTDILHTGANSVSITYQTSRCLGNSSTSKVNDTSLIGRETCHHFAQWHFAGNMHVPRSSVLQPTAANIAQRNSKASACALCRGPNNGKSRLHVRFIDR